MADALGLGVLSWSPLRSGQLSSRYSRDRGVTTDRLRAGRGAGPTERDWTVIDAVARVAADIGVSAAEVALAWVRSRAAVTSTLIGVRTIEQLPPANLASLQTTVMPEQIAALDECSAHGGSTASEAWAGASPDGLTPGGTQWRDHEHVSMANLYEQRRRSREVRRLDRSKAAGRAAPCHGWLNNRTQRRPIAADRGGR